MNLILAIDAGTTGVTAQLVNERGAVAGRGYHEFEQHFPAAGWVEHHPEQIWQATLASVRDALAQASAGVPDGAHPVAIGVTNQRETVVFWNRSDLTAPRPAIVWQDRRTAKLLDSPKFAAAAEKVRTTTGLPMDPYFSSSKLLWVKQNDPKTWRAVEAGQVAVGTVDSYLIARITGGKSHITDASNASRTQLFNLSTLSWDQELLDLFEVPRAALPTVTPSWGQLAQSDPTAFLGITAPITGVAGDQHAALFGQLAFAKGEAKCTYGTGAFLLQNTGSDIVLDDPKLIATVAWLPPSGQPVYALEGSVFIAGAAVQWLRDGLKILDKASDLDPTAAQAPDSGGVIFVPALSGLGAPFWDPNARGTLFGLTRATGRAQIARATIDAIAYQVRALVDAMAKASGKPLKTLRTDGGAAASSLLLQTQADALAISVSRPANLETTALGAAYLAGLGAGVWASQVQLSQQVATQEVFKPQPFDQAKYQRWLKAVAAVRQFAKV